MLSTLFTADNNHPHDEVETGTFKIIDKGVYRYAIDRVNQAPVPYATHIDEKRYTGHSPTDAGKVNYHFVKKDGQTAGISVTGCREYLEDRMVAVDISEINHKKFDKHRWESILKKTAAQLHKMVVPDCNARERKPGSCFISTVIPPLQEASNGVQFKTTLHVGNLGDSSTYLVMVDDLHNQRSHSPRRINLWHRGRGHQAEAQRLNNERALINKHGRLVLFDRSLAITRSLGNVEYDGHGISHEAEVTHYPISLFKHERAFVIISSDGLSDALTVDQIEKIVFSLRYTSENTLKIAQALILAALNNGSKDNISIIVEEINPNKPTEVTRVRALADGHGGDSVARLACTNFTSVLAHHFTAAANVTRRVGLALLATGLCLFGAYLAYGRGDDQDETPGCSHSL